MRLPFFFVWAVCIAFALMSHSIQAHAEPYTVLKDESHIYFAGEHAGNPFKGEFEQWQADITFDPDNLSDSHIELIFDLSGAKTGNKMYDGTLPKSDWFDVDQYPQAVFKSTSIIKASDGEQGGAYTIAGELTLKGEKHTITFSSVIDGLKSDNVTATGGFGVDRITYHIGEGSDPDAKWVSRDINIDFELKAIPAAIHP